MILVTFLHFMVFRICVSDNFYFIVHVFYNLLSFSMKRKTSDSFLAFIILRLVILYSITVCTTKYGSKNTLTALCCNTICLVSWGPYQWIFPLPKKHGGVFFSATNIVDFVYYDLAIKISFSSPNCWQKGPVRKAIRIPSARCF